MIPAAVLLSLLLPQAAPDTDALLEKLRTEDPAERRRVLAELGTRGAEAVPEMIRALDRVSPRPEEEVDRLVKRLGSASWKERTEATASLVRLGRPALPVLEARIASADAEGAWRLRSAVAEIREKAGQDEQLEEIRAAALCDALGQAGDGRAVPTLLRLLGADAPEKRPQLKLRASQALGLLRGTMTPAQAEEASDRVLQILERASAPLDKALLLKSLGRLGAATSVRPLAALLADRSEKNVHLKRSCMTALASIGQARGIRAVAEALEADDVYVRQGAAAVLEELSGAAFGFDPRATVGENREALAKIKSWGEKKYGVDWNQ
jgi:HEAT repeat protein